MGSGVYLQSPGLLQRGTLTRHRQFVSMTAVSTECSNQVIDRASFNVEQLIIGHIGGWLLRVKWPTNSVKALQENRS